MRAIFQQPCNPLQAQVQTTWLLNQQMNNQQQLNQQQLNHPYMSLNQQQINQQQLGPFTASLGNNNNLQQAAINPQAAAKPEVTTSISLGESNSSDDQGKKRNLRPDQADKWNDHFDNLVRFHRQHKHCLVPHTYPIQPDLARWVKRQRYQYKLYKRGKPTGMSAERIKLLDDIGFVWDSHKATWHKTFLELLDFKKEFGNCEVPAKYDKNPALATWVNRQRGQYKLYRHGKQSSMTLQRFLALEEIGFKWEIRPTNPKKRKASANEPSDGKINAKVLKEERPIKRSAPKPRVENKPDPAPMKKLPAETRDYDFFMDVLCDLSDGVQNDNQDGGVKESTSEFLNDIELAPLELPNVETTDTTVDVETAELGNDGGRPLRQTRGILLDVLSDMSNDDDANQAMNDDSFALDISAPPFPDL